MEFEHHSHRALLHTNTRANANPDTNAHPHADTHAHSDPFDVPDANALGHTYTDTNALHGDGGV